MAPQGAHPLTPMKIKAMNTDKLTGGMARLVNRLLEEGSFTGNEEVDQLLRNSPNAIILGLLYEQRIRAEVAFTGAYRLYERLGHLDMQQIANMDPEEFLAAFAQSPAVHRFSNKMADFTQRVARVVANDLDGNAANLWNDGADALTVQKRVQKLPGFGPAKSGKLKYVLHFLGYRDYSDQ